MTQNKFRATYGLDAAGEKVINVATADRTVLTDGVNVEYFYQENTIQEFNKPTQRTYPKGFAVLYNNRIWTAKENVPSSATFNEVYWTALRTDPKWIKVSTGSLQLQVGNYIAVDSEPGSAIELTLPQNPQDGDTVVVKDIGGRPGITDVIIKASTQSIIDRGSQYPQAQMTVPYSEYVFVFVNRLWNLYNASEEPVAKYVNTAGVHQLQSSDTVIRQYDKQAPITVVFPKNANNGDMIHFLGMNTINESEPYFNLVLQSYDATTSILKPGTKTWNSYKSFSGYFAYQSSTKTWVLYDTDKTNRLRTVASDTNLFPNETVSVVGTNNTDVSVINLTLPSRVEDGDQITIALNYMRKNQTVNIVTKSPDKILTTEKLLQFPKRSDYPPSGNWVNTEKLTFNGTSDYPPVITFAYIPMGPVGGPPVLGQWMVVENIPQIERVDPSTDANRARLGVIALATQTQANLNHEDITAAAKETAITAETLANRTANKTRRGIARISTDAENALATDSASYLDDVIVSPKMLNNKQAREDMRGLAEIATQTEVNDSLDDQRIVTPLKLDKRRATETMAGVAKLVEVGGIAPAKGGTNTRDTAGTKIYNFVDHERIVTPKVLREYKATDLALGAVYLATSAEVIAGTANTPGYPLAVTAETLHTKTSTEDRIGLIEIATQAETNAGVDDTRAITPKKLNDRKSTESLTGIAKLATQLEFDGGNTGLISEPAKIKDFFTRQRTSVVDVAGLLQSGNLWTNLKFDIVVPTETQRGTTSLATQNEVDAGSDAIKIVTSKTLHAKKATVSAEGIIQIATNEEVNLGVVTNKAVVPSALKNTIQVDSRWQATVSTRGTVKITENALTFVGNDVSGSTQDLNLYEKNGYAISPYELNKTLLNFMPRKAKAVDSDLLDGIDSTQFVRRDIDQDVNGNITFTKNIATNGTTTNLGMTTLGKLNDGVVSTEKIRLSIYPPTRTTGVWTHSTIDTASDGFYNIKYGSTSIATFKHNGETTLQSLLVGGQTSTNTLFVSQTATVGNSVIVNSKTALSVLNNTLQIGAKGVETEILSNDASTTKLSDASGSYSILTDKNFSQTVARDFVKKSGDVMTGRLTVNAPVTATIPESVAIVGNPSSTTFGSWIASILTKSIYDTLPGYVVPVFGKNEAGQPTNVVVSYDEFKGPGSLSQFSPNIDSAVGTYQMWAPRPTVTTANHQAQTFWMRSWNTAKNQWDGWGRVYTSGNPPTANEIGAVSDSGSTVTSVVVRDYIQIGNVRLRANPINQSLDMEWITP